MIRVEYCPEGIAVPDAKVEAFVKELIDNQCSEKMCYGLLGIQVSTSNVFEFLRVMKKEKDIEVQFKFKGKIITPDKDGRIENWPNGFCDYYDNWLRRLLQNG